MLAPNWGSSMENLQMEPAFNKQRKFHQ
jgi:hypothetical protein